MCDREPALFLNRSSRPVPESVLLPDAGPPDLRAIAARAADPIAWAIAGTVWSGLAHGMAHDALIRGLDAGECERLAVWSFAPVGYADLRPYCGQRQPAPYDEFEELVALLKVHARDDSAPIRWLAHAFATTCMYENHLWQDLQLPSRVVLSDLFAHCFPTLSARNTGNMKWKKFLYKQLCDAAEAPLCKAPSCAVCSDYTVCFGNEDCPLVSEANPAAITRIPVRTFR